MKRLLTSTLAIVALFTLLSSQCEDAVNNFVPDVNTDINHEFNIASSDQTASGEELIDPNSSSDFRDNKSKLKMVNVDQVNFNVVGGTIVNDRNIVNAEVLFKHPDSTSYTSLGVVTNIKLSEMTTAVRFPATAAALNKLGDLALSSTKGVKMKYQFQSDAPGIAFRGKVTLRLTLKLN